MTVTTYLSESIHHRHSVVHTTLESILLLLYFIAATAFAHLSTSSSKLQAHDPADLQSETLGHRHLDSGDAPPITTSTSTSLGPPASASCRAICCISSSTASTTHTTTAPSEVQHYLLKDGGRNYQVRIVLILSTHTHIYWPSAIATRCCPRVLVWCRMYQPRLSSLPTPKPAAVPLSSNPACHRIRQITQSNSRASGLLLTETTLQMRCRR